ncbi:MAG: response regulator transcription factor [Bacteroidia bacterium]|nr:response regulator transcription factor [Bacteroidia bacterium]
MAQKILLADDEVNFGYAMSEFLKMSGYDVTFVNDGKSAYEKYQQIRPDLMLFDVNMPEIDGFELAGIIRATDKNTPIIFITSISDDSSVANGFEIGCNDYLKKPFGLKELQIRVQKSLLISSKNCDIYTLGNLTYSPEVRTLYKQDGSSVSLSEMENKLLEMLCRNFNQTCKNTDIAPNVWGDKDVDPKRSIETLTSNLRRKLTDTNLVIESVRGVGYRLRKG